MELDTVRGNLVSVSASTDAANQQELAAEVRGLREEVGALAEGMSEAYEQQGQRRGLRAAQAGARPLFTLAAMRVGVLTGGGDCPGLNAVIRAVVRKGIRDGHTVTGFENGWAGVMEGNSFELTHENTSGILHRGGTILGTSRTNPFKVDGGADRVRASLEAERDRGAHPHRRARTRSGVAGRLWTEARQPVVGVPKTIDNDLDKTDFTFGFQTAVQIATDAIDRLHTTAESHNRVMVVEVMGRHAGWIAVYSGMAGGADAILMPERPFDVEEVCDRIRRRHESGRTFSIVVVAEGAVKAGTDGPSDGGTEDRRVRPRAPRRHRRRAGARDRGAHGVREPRMTILGHVQRGGTPTAYDRVLATRFGAAAVDAVNDRGVRNHGCACTATEIRQRADRGGAARSPSWSTPSCTRRPRSSSVEPGGRSSDQESSRRSAPRRTTRETLARMVEAGMDVARLNFSHAHPGAPRRDGRAGARGGLPRRPARSGSCRTCPARSCASARCAATWPS